MKRALHDHGTAQDAIDYALDALVFDDAHDRLAFLACWQNGALDEWPEFYPWLDRRALAQGADKP